MDNLNIVYSESDIDPVEAFEKHSLLKVGDNLYQRISKDDLNEMYQISTVLAKHNLTHFLLKYILNLVLRTAFWIKRKYGT